MEETVKQHLVGEVLTVPTPCGMEARNQEVTLALPLLYSILEVIQTCAEPNFRQKMQKLNRNFGALRDGMIIELQWAAFDKGMSREAPPVATADTLCDLLDELDSVARERERENQSLRNGAAAKAPSSRTKGRGKSRASVAE